MQVTIKPGKPKGSLVAPPSKSYAHRYLIAGAFSLGCVSNLSWSDDVVASLNCLKSLGFKCETEGDRVSFIGFERINEVPKLECNESGSTLRFFIPIAMALYNKATFIGTPKLISRGIEAYEECLKGKVSFTKKEDSIIAEGGLTPGGYVIDASKSSQYVSGMLLALSLLDKESSLSIKSELNSKPYVDMTIDVLSKFGITIEDEGCYLVKNPRSFIRKDIANEGDYSNAAFLDAFNLLGGDIKLSGLNPDSIQGDKVYIECFDKLDQGFAEIDVENCIDLSPVLFSFASLKRGGHFLNTARLAIKESNRALVMKEELEKCGAVVEVNDNDVIVKPSNEIAPLLEFDSHNDHRIAMALSLYAIKSAVIINDAGCVDKSYPNYYKDLESLGMEVIYDVTK